jgi:hypothetical protein
MLRILVLALSCSMAVAAQTSEEGIRQLWNSQFLEKRPPAKKPSATAKKPPVYKTVAKTAKPVSPNDTLLGLTLWLLRKPRPADDPNSRLLILEDDSSTPAELVPERLEADSPVQEGDRVRLTVEVPRTGYLYVLDREQYADGSVSPAYLIYPNHRTRPGDNAVAGGRVVEIPDQRDRPNHFRVRRSRADQTAELLSLLVTPEPLDNIKIGATPLKISEEQFAEWEKKYGVQAERFELSGGAGSTYTSSEKQAGSTAAVLTQDDPFPQTLYRVSAEPGKPLLLNLPVQIKR